jgi:hypothetical protein
MRRDFRLDDEVAAWRGGGWSASEVGKSVRRKFPTRTGVGVIASLLIVPLALTRRVAACLLGGLFLWQVADHAGSTSGRAIVHVLEPRVDVTVDEKKYWIETLGDTPIVCDLRPGRHTVRMLRDGRVLYEESFSIAVGQELMFTAWDESPDDGRCTGLEP